MIYEVSATVAQYFILTHPFVA